MGDNPLTGKSDDYLQGYQDALDRMKTGFTTRPGVIGVHRGAHRDLEAARKGTPEPSTTSKSSKK